MPASSHRRLQAIAVVRGQCASLAAAAKIAFSSFSAHQASDLRGVILTWLQCQMQGPVNDRAEDARRVAKLLQRKAKEI